MGLGLLTGRTDSREQEGMEATGDGRSQGADGKMAKPLSGKGAHSLPEQ